MTKELNVKSNAGFDQIRVGVTHVWLLPLLLYKNCSVG